MNNIFFAKKRSLRKFFNQLFLISPHKFSCGKSNDFCGAPLKLRWNLTIPAEISPFFFLQIFFIFSSDFHHFIISSPLLFDFLSTEKNFFSLKFFMRVRWKISAGFSAVSQKLCWESFDLVECAAQNKLNGLRWNICARFWFSRLNFSEPRRKLIRPNYHSKFFLPAQFYTEDFWFSHTKFNTKSPTENN